jgi:hypothetical protein
MQMFMQMFKSTTLMAFLMATVSGAVAQADTLVDIGIVDKRVRIRNLKPDHSVSVDVPQILDNHMSSRYGVEYAALVRKLPLALASGYTVQYLQAQESMIDFLVFVARCSSDGEMKEGQITCKGQTAKLLSEILETAFAQIRDGARVRGLNLWDQFGGHVGLGVGQGFHTGLEGDKLLEQIGVQSVGCQKAGFLGRSIACTIQL